MPDSRLPKLCLNELIKLNSSVKNNLDHNWFSVLLGNLSGIGLNLDNSNPITLVANKIDIINALSNNYISSAINRVFNSEFNPHYRHSIEVFGQTQEYFFNNLSIAKKRLLFQLRVSSHSLIRLNWGGKWITIDTSQPCQTCNSNNLENLDHILFYCPSYNTIRHHLLFRDPEALQNLSLSDPVAISSLFKFLVSALSVRKDSSPENEP